jgi:hypothetical protein
MIVVMRRMAAVTLAIALFALRADAQEKTPSPNARAPAGAPDKQAAARGKQTCAQAFDDAQGSRKSGKLLAARVQLITCAADVCPAAVRRACSELLPSVEAATPHVMIAAKDAHGADTLDVRVVVDGAPFVDRLLTTAIPIDPGEHAVVFEAVDGARLEQRIVTREGETKELVADFSPKNASQAPAPAPTDVPSSSPTSVRDEVPLAASRREADVWPWIAGGAAAAGVASFGLFAILGSSQQSSLDQCAPNCARSDVATMRRDYLVADISLGVAIVAAGVVTWLLVAPPRSRLALTRQGARF